jgi:nucleotide-binding universal stress UspA family protein
MTATEMITREMDTKELFDPEVKTKSIVVATDGSEAALAGFKIAAMMAKSTAMNIHVLSVLEPMPVMFPAVEGLAIPPQLDYSRQEAQRRIVGDQIRAYDAAAAWTLDVTVGRRAEVIVSFAHEQDADLIILGMHKHGVIGRILGEETANEVARLSNTPILVAPEITRLPKRVVVAMGLNHGGMESLPEIIPILADNPSISCVHVKPRSESMGIDWAALDGEYELAMKERFREIETALQPVGMRADLVVLNGDASHELAEFAEYSKAELLVVGINRRLGKSRAVGGRMAARLLRHAPCSILVLPSAASA